MALDDQRLLTENPRTFEQRIANVTAYQWFGASVSPRTWSDLWLSAEDWAAAFGAPDPGTPHNEAREETAKLAWAQLQVEARPRPRVAALSARAQA